MRGRRNIPVVMTIAGSDSGGGAGIQADLKTFEKLGAFGTSAITCITAQNPKTVRGIAPISARMVALQIATVREAFFISAAKTGMLYSASIIKAAAAALERPSIPALVIDPVMIATSGARLLKQDAVKALRARLLPLATVVTPNIPEAEILCGFKIDSLKTMRAAAKAIAARYGTSCIVKGGHMSGRNVVEVLFDLRPLKGQKEELSFTAPRASGVDTHGTGCTFSAALVAFLARGFSLARSARQAQLFVGKAIRAARSC